MKYLNTKGLLTVTAVTVSACSVIAQNKAPNILYIMSDDHASQAIGVYAKTLKDYVNTPNIDRIANEGVRVDNCFVTNSISSPSRACILTGQYSHHNGVYTLFDTLPEGKDNMAKELQKSGYNTGVIGKWHLDSEPEGFDYYSVLPGQGKYDDPGFMQKGDKPYGVKNQVKYEGYCTDIITNKCIDWMEQSKKESESKPFFLMCHFKAPHTPFTPASRHENLFAETVFPEPDNLYDDYAGRPSVKRATLKIENNREIDKSLSREEQRKVSYQNFVRKYLRCIASVDENVGRLLEYLEKSGEIDNTIIIYTSDQGFFMGEHGLVDKRLMYEESLRMPLLIRYPKEIKAGSKNADMIMNIDFAPTILDYAGVESAAYMDGTSFRQNLQGATPKDWRKSIYYRYWMNFKGYNVPAHYGIRTHKYKLIYYYGQSCGTTQSIDRPKFTPVWELYDLETDPMEMINIYNLKKHASVIKELKKQLSELQVEAGDKLVF